MNVEDNTSAPNDSTALTASVESTGTAARTVSEIAPEHQHHVDAILAIDPLAAPNTHSIPEGWGASLTLRASALSDPEQRRAVEAKLAALPADMPVKELQAKEASYVADILRQQRGANILKLGLGKDATPYHRELRDIASEVQDLYRQHDRLQADLDYVARYELELDPETGERKPVPVYAVTGQRAKAYVTQQEDILRRIRLLVNDDGTPGIEGAKRARAALAESVAARVELERQAFEEAVARQRAEEINREKRINQRAESLARLNRNGG